MIVPGVYKIYSGGSQPDDQNSPSAVALPSQEIPCLSLSVPEHVVVATDCVLLIRCYSVWCVLWIDEVC